MIYCRQRWHTVHSLSSPKSSCKSVAMLSSRSFVSITSRAMNSSCANPCRSSKSMYWTSKRLGQSGQVCLCWPHQKHTVVLGSFGRDGMDALGAGGTYLEGFEVVAIGSAYRKIGGGGLGSLVGS